MNNTRNIRILIIIGTTIMMIETTILQVEMTKKTTGSGDIGKVTEAVWVDD